MNKVFAIATKIHFNENFLKGSFTYYVTREVGVKTKELSKNIHYNVTSQRSLNYICHVTKIVKL